MKKSSRILVAEDRTLLGAAIMRELQHQGYREIFGTKDSGPDLRSAGSVEAYFAWYRPEYVFLAAGLSGGIRTNQAQPADLIRDNLLVASHTIDAAQRHGVRRLLYLASSCSYPREAPQPLRPESLLTGSLEPTNEAYAVAKIAGIKLCESYRAQYGADFLCGIPSNPFGIGDNFSLADSHVIPAIIRRIDDAQRRGAPEVELWGTGRPRRDFIFAADAASAAIAVMNGYTGCAPINIGCGVDISITELAQLIAEIVGYEGTLRFNSDLPDGMPVKLLDSSALQSLGWRPHWTLRTAIAETYRDYQFRFGSIAQDVSEPVEVTP